jgi:preprotein translocase subunit SecD
VLAAALLMVAGACVARQPRADLELRPVEAGPCEACRREPALDEAVAGEAHLRPAVGTGADLGALQGAVDEEGRFVLLGEVEAATAARIAAALAAHPDRSLAVVVEGRVLSVAKVEAPLAGRCVLAGADTAAELHDLLDASTVEPETRHGAGDGAEAVR